MDCCTGSLLRDMEQVICSTCAAAFIGAFGMNVVKIHLLVLSYLFACNISRTAEWIFMKFYIGELS
jgi:hypothetical protein